MTGGSYLDGWGVEPQVPGQPDHAAQELTTVERVARWLGASVRPS